MQKRVRAFYAFPNEPAHVGETIENTKRKLSTDGALTKNNIHFHLWKDGSLSGRPLISSILEEVDKRQIFACDLTYPNPNVSFELGFAIATFKRIFASLNPSIADAEKQYRNTFFPLLNMVYSSYENHESLADALLQVKPWNSLGQTLLNDSYKKRRPRAENPTLVYVKPPSSTESVLAIQEELRRSHFSKSLIVDDPNELSSPSIEWYAGKFLESDGVIIHLLSTEDINHALHNQKASVVAGLAYGFDVPMIMLAHHPFKPPLDYERWLRVHETAKSCLGLTKDWLDDLSAGLSHRRPRRQRTVASPSSKIDIRTLFLGDHVAEHETENLNDYFVETASFYRAMDDQFTILVGRRGTGKTAILYAIEGEANSTNTDHVTVLKPVGYETRGLIRVLQELRQHSERGFLIESLWKFLIYSEIAADFANKLHVRPAHQVRSFEEEAFLEYYERHSKVLSRPFSERIDRAVTSLAGVGEISSSVEQRLKISESLHNSLISDLRTNLGNALTSKNCLRVLIDGLDEPWVLGEHIGYLAELIGGLLEVARSVPDDFRRSSSRISPVNAKITVLLRSDIFAFIKKLVREQDKLPIERVTWDDPKLLLRVLEERMLHNAPKNRTIEQVWSTLFPKTVDGLNVAEFLLHTVLPRPRDLIYFVKTAANVAINRGRQAVAPEDIYSAREQYSLYAFNSILNEDDPSKGLLEEVLYQFVKATRELSKVDVKYRFALAGVTSRDEEFYLDLLCDVGFLGIESASGFQYARHEEDRRTFRRIAGVLASKVNRSEMFEINPAFYQVLGIEQSA